MRVTYLTAAILDLNRTPLPQCEGVDGFDCSDPAIVFNVDARQYFCGDHHRVWEKYNQSHDPYEFGQWHGCTCDWHEEPQTLVERVCEYMQKQGM